MLLKSYLLAINYLIKKKIDKPFLATKRLAKQSGILAPKAIKVIPIIVSGIKNV